MFYIEHRFEVSAAHRLLQLPIGHKCRQTHGHNYMVALTLRANFLDEFSFVLEFSKLRDLFQDLVADKLDHAYLNDAMCPIPTAERMARWIHDQLADSIAELGRDRHLSLEGVEVQETRDCSATYMARGI